MTKKTTRQSDRNLEQFKAELTEGHYNTVVGARRGAAYLPEKDKEIALKLVAKHFGVGVDEPGEATRGARKGKVGGVKKKVSKKPAKKVAKKAAAAPAIPAKGAKKKVSKRKAAAKATTPPPAPVGEAEAVVAAGASKPKTEPAKKVRAVRGSKKAAAKGGEKRAASAPSGGVLSDLGIVQNICGTVDTALKTMQLARSLSGDKLDLSEGLREVVETTGAAIASLRKHLPTTVEAAPAPVPAAGPMPEMSNGERPTNMEALTAAAAGAGFPPPVTAQHVS